MFICVIWSQLRVLRSARPFASIGGSPSLARVQVGLSTPEVFRALDLSARSSADPLFLLGLHTTGAAGPDKHVNDLEKPAFQCVPALAALKRRLGADDPDGVGFPVVSMSGSGTSLFCLGEPTVADWAERINAEGAFPWPVKVFKTAFLNRSPGSWYTVSE